MIFATLLFLAFHPVIIAFLTLLLKILVLQEKVPNASAGRWLQILIVLFTFIDVLEKQKATRTDSVHIISGFTTDNTSWVY